MKKFLSFFVFSLLVANLAMAQTTLMEDDFESYNVGDFISTSEHWTTWGGSTGGSDDAVITDAFNNTAGGAKSLKIVANNDIVSYFGDKTSGKYQINFQYYVKTGDGGYFNIQHAFGSEWAFSVNFNNGGTAVLSSNGATSITFPFPQDAWFPVSIDVDLDADLVALKINNSEAVEWQFSTKEAGGAGQNILDCINFFGSTEVTGNPEYYIDDFAFVELQSGTLPADLQVNVENLTFSTDEAQSFTITNAGEDPLNYQIFTEFPQPTTYNKSQNIVSVSLNNQDNTNTDFSTLNTKDEVFLSYFGGTAATSIGWSNSIEIHAAVLFDNQFIKNHKGLFIDRVEIFCGDMPLGNPTVEIWEGYDIVTGGPANLVTSQDFTPIENGMVLVELDEPVYISGTDIWVGWTYTDGGEGVFSLAMDAGPPVQNVNYVKTGVAWGAINADDRGNFGISAVAAGTPMLQWLEIDVTEGALNGGENQTITLTPNPDGLEFGTYECNVVIKNNDIENYWTVIPVMFEYDAINEFESVEIMSYPNPATDVFTVQSNINISNIQIVNSIGQTVDNTYYNKVQRANIDISRLAKGMYHVNVTTEKGITTTKLLVK